MLKFLLSFLLTQSIVFACALCSVYSPQTKVAINVNSTDTKIKSIDVKWVITKEFTDQLKQIYDTNLDNKLDEYEMKFIQKALVDYASIKNFMTHISYGEVIDKQNSDLVKVSSYEAKIIDGILHFFYTIDVDYDIKNDYALYIKINDDENYFVLLLEKNYLNFKNKAKISKIVDTQSVIFHISNVATYEKAKHTEEKIVKKEEIKKENLKAKQEKEKTLLDKFVQKVKKYLVAVQKGDNLALFTLLFVSFIYGIIHALGPGHGKTLAFSYFTSNKSSYSKAFIISLASAFVHILGALILVSISVFILQSVLNSFVSDSVKILTQISAVMIMLLAFYILLQKLNNKGCSCSSCSTKNSNAISFSTSSSLSLKANDKIDFQNLKKKKRSDLYFVLTAGLIPCPGTVILFIYAFILKTYFAVLLASIAISFGMGLVIFASSFLGVSLHKLSSKSHRFTYILEITSPIIMFILGLFLLFSSNSL
ncbi:nickel/cobalt transporter [Malaciobacter canalis]|uniref:nickel/cobalt transporter n=1 Tax=Malaciobacter canalis TaxID=1912871 RepID=UPI00384ACB43